MGRSPGDLVVSEENVSDENLEGDAVEMAPALPDDEFLRGLIEPFEGAVWESSHGQDVVRVPREDLEAFARAAKESGFGICSAVTAVDWYRKRRTRFDVVIMLLSEEHLKRLRIITEVPEDDPVVPSMVPIWPGANFAEREVYDMFGIRFEGHPDLTRILMPDDWAGYPLRKDFSVGAVPVQFKESHKAT